MSKDDMIWITIIAIVIVGLVWLGERSYNLGVQHSAEHVYNETGILSDIRYSDSSTTYVFESGKIVRCKDDYSTYHPELKIGDKVTIVYYHENQRDIYLLSSYEILEDI